MSFKLREITGKSREQLIERLWNRQNGRCYISEKLIDLKLHANQLDIDHIQPTRDNGADSEENWGLTFSSYNRSKQASDLRVAKILVRLESIRAGVIDIQGANLGHVLDFEKGGRFFLPITVSSENIRYSLSDMGDPDVIEAPVWQDKLSGMRYCFLQLPIEYLHHDEKLNPRSIGNNVRGLIEEFFKGMPLLHAPLAWIDHGDGPTAKIRVFDGQHKAAAQILLGVRSLPIRVFIDPDKNILLTANTNAGTALRQVAFDKSTQRRLGSSILRDRIDRFRRDKNHPEDYWSFNEQQIVDHFRGEQASVKRYVIDAQRTAVTESVDNLLRPYIEYAGKSPEKAFSYSAIEKAIYSTFISDELLSVPWNYREDEGFNPRTLEREQLVRLLNIVAKRIYQAYYDLENGGAQIESKVQKGININPNHLCAHRMAREEILSAWMKRILEVMQNYFATQNDTFDSLKPMQKHIPDLLWLNIENYVVNMSKLPLWRDFQLSSTVFGGKRLTSYWRSVLTTGVAPDGTDLVAQNGLSLTSLIRPPA